MPCDDVDQFDYIPIGRVEVIPTSVVGGGTFEVKVVLERAVTASQTYQVECISLPYVPNPVSNPTAAVTVTSGTDSASISFSTTSVTQTIPVSVKVTHEKPPEQVTVVVLVTPPGPSSMGDQYSPPRQDSPTAGPAVGGPRPLVAPLGARAIPLPWEGRITRKPWDYPITAVIPHLETVEPLRAVVELLRLQTQRPYIIVIDTGSSDVSRAALEGMRGPDLEIHYIAGHAYRHSSGAVGVAQDVGLALCRSEYLFCTHADCFLRRRDYLEFLLRQCGPECPVVGYEMSPRDWITDDWQGMVSHTATLLHMPTIRGVGANWDFERAHSQFGVPRGTNGWPDTETTFNLVLRGAGIKPRLIGHEENFKRHVDENVDHVRSYPGSLVYAAQYHETAQEWMAEALMDAWERVSRWRTAAS